MNASLDSQHTFQYSTKYRWSTALFFRTRQPGTNILYSPTPSFQFRIIGTAVSNTMLSLALGGTAANYRCRKD